MKLLVCGGREFDDEAAVGAALDALHGNHGLTHLIHGGAQGADAIASWWAAGTRDVQEVICPAKWDVNGRAAGPIRNRAMADLSPDLVLAFKGGRGTENMVKTAEDLGIPVERVK
jgi:hypothetical protein